MLTKAIVKHPDLKVYLYLILGLLLVFYFAYAINPAGRSVMLAEDSILENLTAFFYFEAFVIGLWYWQSRKTGLFLPVLALIGGLEEMTYGERLFGYQISSLTGIQTEVLHNIPEMIPYHVKFFIIASIVACVALFFLFYFKWLSSPKVICFGQNLLANIYIRFFLIFIVIAETIDLFRIPIFAVLIEETFELAAAVSLLFAVRQAAHAQKHEGEIIKSTS
jgi:hypothetical protein